MNATSASLPALGDSQVVRALEEYAEALEAGRRPSREDILTRYADSAGVLAKCIDALDFVRSAAPQVQMPDTAEPALEASVPLGDYRIEREIGRGGMGVVYEAQQLSLGRRVALKVLPFAATMDKRQLQRFHNEARAAACLQHPHIVPVYAVGCSRGVHYYAMQFIDGQSLDAVLQTSRNQNDPASPAAPAAPDAGLTVDSGTKAKPARETVREPRAQASTILSQGRGKEQYRKIAELAFQAADALEHAHQSGVVHRDIKPANLLVDDEAHLWITDFGLAQIQTDTRLTLTGDLVGTLRYMSPEQALAKRVIVDHRTDLYSLGATFYEVLTLKPVFGGQDRQELLRQIAFEEPIAMRRLNRQIPAELETVILKAIEKNPAERYGTAKEMADDLRRFLNDEPTLARRPTLVQRVRKWSRRHVAAVRATAAAFLAIVAVVAATGGWWLRDQAAREVETERAVAAIFQDADRLQKEWKIPEALATAKQSEDILASGVASSALKERVKARLADLNLVAELEDIRASRAGLMDGINHDNARIAQKYRNAFLKAGINVVQLPVEDAAGLIRQRTVPMELAGALDEWASVLSMRTSSDKTLAKRLLTVARAADADEMRGKFRKALEQEDLEALKALSVNAKADELSPPTVVALGRALYDQGAYDEAEKLLEQCQRRYPTDFWVNYHLGSTLLQNQEVYVSTITNPWQTAQDPEWTDRVDSPKKYEEAIRYFSLAVALRPNSPIAHYYLGVALNRKGRYPEAIVVLRQALELSKNIRAAYFALGFALSHNGKLDEAIAAYRQNIRVEPNYTNATTNVCFILERQGKRDEAVVEFRLAIKRWPEQTAPYINLGNLLARMGKLEESIAEYKKIVRLFPGNSMAHDNLGVAYSRNLQIEDAIQEYQKAVELNPNDAHAHRNLGATFMKLGRMDEALASFVTAHRVNPDKLQHHIQFGLALRHYGKPDDAIAEYHKALELRPAYIPAFVHLGNALLDKGRIDEAIMHYRGALSLSSEDAPARCHLAYALGRKGLPKEAIGAYRKAIQLELKSNAIDTLKLSMRLGKSEECQDFLFLAMAHWQLGDREKAREDYNKGVELMQQNPAGPPELETFRAEAAELLGIQAPPVKGKDKKTR